MADLHKKVLKGEEEALRQALIECLNGNPFEQYEAEYAPLRKTGSLVTGKTGWHLACVRGPSFWERRRMRPWPTSEM